VSVNDTSWLMRTRFTGTWFDERNDVGAGPYALIGHPTGRLAVDPRKRLQPLNVELGRGQEGEHGGQQELTRLWTPQQPI